MTGGRLVDLADADACVPATAGAKAARLAAARAAGLAALPGYVVPVPESAKALRRGLEALKRHGSGGARLAVMEVELDGELTHELDAAGEELGAPLVVRSSSPLEADVSWAGAFTSYLDLGADELPVAVRGCWTSAFAPDTLERCEATGTHPESLAVAALVQPQVSPAAGGTAAVEGDEAVTVAAVAGSPAPLLQGWEPGERAVVDRDGRVRGPDARQRFGDEVLREVATVARATCERLGDDAVEWAAAGGEVVLLQSTRRAAEPASPVPRLQHAAPGEVLASEPCVRVARLVRRFPGELGEALVLPWALSAAELPTAGEAEHAPPAQDPCRQLEEARARARDLTARAWNLPPGRAAEAAKATLAALRGRDAAGAASRLARLCAVPAEEGEAVIAGVHAVGRRLARDGLLEHASEVWSESPADLADRLRTARRRPHPSAQARPDRWESLVFSVTAAAGSATTGVPASPGAGAGVARGAADPAHPPRIGPREVLVADRPLPQLSSLLWNAAGLVTTGGGPAAHVMEIARSLNVPAATGCRVDDLLAAEGGAFCLVAVDGNRGSVSVLPL